MAPYFYDPLLDEEQKRKQGQELSISGASPTSNAQGQSISTPSAQQGFNTGSGFVNLDKYLKAHEGSQFGNQVVGKVEETVNQAPQALDEREKQFKQTVDQANPVRSNEEIDKDIAHPEQANKEQFGKTLKQTYQGPLNLAETPELEQRGKKQIENAVHTAGLLGSEGGRYQLFDRYFGRPGYNEGQKKLDSLIYQGTRPAEKEANLKQFAENLNARERQQATELGNYGAGKKGDVERSREYARSAIGIGPNGEILEGEKAGAIGKKRSEANQRVADQNKYQKEKFEKIKNYLEKGEIPKQVLKDLGIADLKGEPLYDVKPEAYLEAGPEATKEQVLDKDEANYIRALEDLADIKDHSIGEGGQFGKPSYSFNKDAFRKAVGDVRLGMNNKLYDQKVNVQGDNMTIKQAQEQINKYQKLLPPSSDYPYKNETHKFAEQRIAALQSAIAKGIEKFNQDNPTRYLKEGAL